MLKIRLLQLLFLGGIATGVAVAASGLGSVGALLIALGTVGFFTLSGIIAYVKAKE